MTTEATRPRVAARPPVERESRHGPIAHVAFAPDGRTAVAPSDKSTTSSLEPDRIGTRGTAQDRLLVGRTQEP